MTTPPGARTTASDTSARDCVSDGQTTRRYRGAPGRALTLAVAALGLLAGCAPPPGAARAAGPAALLYVANTADATVTRLDAASGQPVGRPLPAGAGPSRVAPGPAAAGGAHSLLVLTAAAGGTDDLTRVSRAGAGWAARPVPLGVGAWGAHLAGDGGRYGAVAYHVRDDDAAGPRRRCRLLLVDHASGTVVRRHPVCAGPEFVTGLALADGPAGPVAFLGIMGLVPPAPGAGAAWPAAANRIVAVDAQTGAVLATRPLAGVPRHLLLAAAPGRDGRRLYGLEASPEAWAEYRAAPTGRLLGLDPATLAVEGEWPLDPLPTALAVAPDGDHLYALSAHLLTHVALGTGTQRPLTVLPWGASALAVTDARVYAAASAGHDVWAVERRGGRLVATIPVGRHPAHLALGAAG